MCELGSMAYGKKFGRRKFKKPVRKTARKRKAVSGSSYKSNKRVKRSGGQTVMRGKARKVGTNHWLTVFKPRHAPLKSWMRGLIKTANKYHWNTNNAFQILTLPGVQAFDGLSANVWSPYDLVTLDGNINTHGEPLILLEAQCRLFGTNQTNANQFVEIYELKARRDMTSNNVNTATLNPDAIMRNTSYEDTANDCFQIGFTPFEKRSLCEFYKIQNVTRYNLSSGESFEHMFVQKPNWKFDTFIRDAPVSAIVNCGSFQKLTTYMLVVQWGAPSNAITDKTQVSSSAGAVDYVFTKKYTVVPVSAPVTITNKFVNNLPTTWSSAQNVMELDGDVKPEIVA